MQELCKELKLPKQLLECTSAEMIQVLSRIPLHSSLNGDDGAADQTRAGTPIIHTPCFHMLRLSHTYSICILSDRISTQFSHKLWKWRALVIHDDTSLYGCWVQRARRDGPDQCLRVRTADTPQGSAVAAVT